jgi:transposase
MPTSYRPYMPEQALLLPTSLSEWLAEDHLAYFISDAVDALDLEAFHARYEGDGRRRQPFDPCMMVKVLIYGYATGVFSSRKMARKLQEDVAFRILSANNQPAHRTIREFRQLHLKEFSALFVQVVKLAKEAGLVSLGRVGVDGTKIKANASKRKAMSYTRLQDEELRLKREIAGLLNQAESQDQADEDRHGPDDQDGGLPPELKRRSERLKIIQEAKARIEERARQADKADGRFVDDAGVTRSMSGRTVKRSFGQPEPDAQSNFTDPDSRIMATAGGSFEQCYNAQAAVDEGSQLIVAADLVNHNAEASLLVPMLDQVQYNTGSDAQVLLADTNYASERALSVLADRGVEAYVALGREDHKQLRYLHGVKQPALRQMAQRLRTPEGAAHYRRRKVIPEPVFGWIKQVLGFRTFSLRGLLAVRAEWQLVCAAMNLRRLHRLGWQPA